MTATKAVHREGRSNVKPELQNEIEENIFNVLKPLHVYDHKTL